jgi:pimeloyl-ACP methyl ester carboxylesterase
MSEREDLTFPSGEDTCAAWLYRPDGVAGAVPCIVMAHGFTATRGDRLPAYAERFAAAGLAVLLFDYRHFGDSTGTPRQLLDIGRQQADYHAAVAFARTLEGVDAQRIALFGTSFSGGHVVVVATQDPSIAAVVSQCPFADGLAALRVVPPRVALRATALGLADQAAALAGRAPRMMPAVGAPGSFAVMTAPDAQPGFDALVPQGSPWRNEVAARIMLRVATYRPVRSAASVACPLLVCVCEGDQTTPPGAAIKMGERAPRGEVLRYPVGHFEIYLGEPFEQAVAAQTAFLRRHLAPVAPAAAVV